MWYVLWIRPSLRVRISEVSNATSIHVRRPGNPKKWKATVLCEAKSSDLALLTVEEDLFWQDDLQALSFVEVPNLQVSRLLSKLSSDDV